MKQVLSFEQLITNDQMPVDPLTQPNPEKIIWNQNYLSFSTNTLRNSQNFGKLQFSPLKTKAVVPGLKGSKSSRSDGEGEEEQVPKDVFTCNK